MAHERAADRAALNVLLGRPAAVGPSTGLQVQGCCLHGGEENSSKAAEPEPTLVEELADQHSAGGLADAVEALTDSEVDEVLKETEPGSFVHTGASWEQALRRGDWAALDALSGAGPAELCAFYGPRVVDQILDGSLTVTVVGEMDFVDWVDTQLHTLASVPSGFRLLVQLLATAMPVVIEATTEGSEAESSEDGDMHNVRADQEWVPADEWELGEGAGSTVRLDRTQLESDVEFVGRSGGKLAPVRLNTAASVGHELIHALHAAHGESFPSRSALGVEQYVFPDVAGLGDYDAANEIRTITGQTVFTDFDGATFSGPFPRRISENDIRDDLGLDPRLTHGTFTPWQEAHVPAGVGIDGIVALFRDFNGDPLSESMAEVVADLIREANPDLEATTGGPILLPTLSRIRMELHNLGRTGLLEEVDDPGLLHPE